MGNLAYPSNQQEPHWKDLVDGYHVLTQKELQKFPQSSKSVRIFFCNVIVIIFHQMNDLIVNCVQSDCERGGTSSKPGWQWQPGHGKTKDLMGRIRA